MGEISFVESRQWSPDSSPSPRLGRRAIERLAEWGLDVPRDVRLARATALLENALTSDPQRAASCAASGPALAEAARDVLEFFVATHASRIRPSDTVLAKFAQAIRGADLPDGEQGHLARDTQFELLVWGLMNASGTPCRFEEPPDLVCTLGAEELGIAVKRVWSQAKARRRLGRAAQQIQTSGLPGFIAVNAQEYLGADFALIDGLGELREAFQDRVTRLRGHLRYLGSKPHVIGVLLCGTVSCMTQAPNGSPWLRTRNLLHVEPFGENDELPPLAKRFSEGQPDAFEKWLESSIAETAG